VIQSDERLAVFERKTQQIFIGPDCENYLGWRLRYYEELYELLDGPYTVKYMKFKRIIIVSAM
jgi:hypothetical protein